MLRSIHLILAYLTVLGFVVRGIWSMTGSAYLTQKWVKILPHVIDTLLLVLGVAMAISLSISPLEGWLAAKLVSLLAYIGFGVLTMRASGNGLKIVGFVGAMASVGYIFAVAFARSPWPF
ncbi:MAG: SirB2 family protein [Gammaproteobacteria bacterium]|nr:SirB2 family protein [Gammaproteobacteria bacterium]